MDEGSGLSSPSLPLSLLLESVSSASRELPAPGGMWSSLAPGLEGARDFHTWALCDPSWDDTDVPCHVPLWQRGGPELNGLSTPWKNHPWQGRR